MKIWHTTVPLRWEARGGSLWSSRLGPILAVALSALFPPNSAAAQSAESERPPNVIILLGDDLSAKDLGVYGNNDLPTPNLERLADQGVRFATCWATPICGPSRAQLMTGRYGFRTGWFHNRLQRQDPLSDYNPTLGKLLREAGYRTTVVGKWQMPGTQEQYGYDEYFMWLGNHQLIRELKPKFEGPIEKKGHKVPGRPARFWHPALVHEGELVPTGPDDYGPELMLNYIKDFMEENMDRPFFVYYPMLLPHKSWDFENNRYGYLPAPEVGSDGKLTGEKTGTTIEGNVAFMDFIVGEILQQAEDLGIADDTVIFFTTDNGSGDYGKGFPGAHQERGPRVPMVVSGGGVEALGESRELIQFADVLPTVADLIGVEIPGDYIVDGESFAALFMGKPFEGRDWIFSYLGEQRFLRTEEYLLDANGELWFCGDRRDEKDYVNVTNSDDPEVEAIREKFDRILADLPKPNPEWEETQGYREWMERRARNN